MAPKKGQTNNPHGRPKVKPCNKRTVSVKITPNERSAVEKQKKEENYKGPIGKYLVDKTLKK